MRQIREREGAWDQIGIPWDILIIGGGIVGAGLLREAARAGLRALLVEARDYASGTSSRSSKMVHGGFRYLATGQVGLTMDSVRERQRLLREGRGLVDPLEILLVHHRGDSPPAWMIGAGLILYDVLAGRWQHVRKSKRDVERLCPELSREGVAGGFRFFDAQTDDARLVWRVLQEGVHAGGTALSYTRVEGLLRGRDGMVRGAQIRDAITGRAAEVQATIVINATGAWADELRAQVGRKPRLRLLRGSHLVFPREKFPLRRQITFQHPVDGRFMLLFPWEGITLVGNTDIDHRDPMETDPRIGANEAEYLMAAVNAAFGSLHLSLKDARASISGIRSVLDTGNPDPSKESRDEVLWDEDGLVTITGGKLTTFRHMAQRTLGFIRRRLPGAPRPDSRARVLDAVPDLEEFLSLAGEAGLDSAAQKRLLGRHGKLALTLLRDSQPGDLQAVAELPTLWAELRWAAQTEAVTHLEDLLLRRTRLGLLLPDGASAEMGRIRSVCQAALGWDDQTWQVEWNAYRALWTRAYSPPAG